MPIRQIRPRRTSINQNTWQIIFNQSTFSTFRTSLVSQLHVGDAVHEDSTKASEQPSDALATPNLARRLRSCITVAFQSCSILCHGLSHPPYWSKEQSGLSESWNMFNVFLWGKRQVALQLTLTSKSSTQSYFPKKRNVNGVEKTIAKIDFLVETNGILGHA